MEVLNAFIGKSSRPSENELSAALGSSAPAWSEFIHWMEAHGASSEEWKMDGTKYGWSLRLRRKDQNIVYLGPCKGCFRVSFVLGARAMEAVREKPFPAAVAQMIAESPRYPEGTGIRLIVRQSRDLASVRTLALLKLAD